MEDHMYVQSVIAFISERKILPVVDVLLLCADKREVFARFLLQHIEYRDCSIFSRCTPCTSAWGGSNNIGPKSLERRMNSDTFGHDRIK
jgi:hypothetical protein